MRKETFLFFLFYVIIHITSSGQQVVTTSGDFYQNTNGSISWTLGEIMTDTYTNNQSVLTQGFQQPNLKVTSITELPGLDYSITAFPNPAKEFVKLKIEKEDVNGMQYDLLDMSGKVIESKKIQNSETEISFADLIPATYFIRITENDIEIKIFKIVKQ
jgi:hypothetical protein